MGSISTEVIHDEAMEAILGKELDWVGRDSLERIAVHEGVGIRGSPVLAASDPASGPRS